MTPTIYALSSGNLPAAIAVIRVSGPAASDALTAIAGRVPEPRFADLATLRHPVTRQVIDKALILFFPGPRSETGEDLAEFHLHGGRAVAAALCGALATIDGLRSAEAGEFTRQAFDNGKLDLTAVEGLADLVSAETEAQHRAALAVAGGALSREIEAWQARLLALAARLEAALDFADEQDVGDHLPDEWNGQLRGLVGDLGIALARPPAERLRDGVRVVIAGPPNAGKSSLLNALAGRDAAITSANPGTTRDVVEAPTALGGVPFLLADTAGLRDSEDAVEAIGVERGQARLASADTILWLGPPSACPDRSRSLVVQSKADLVPASKRDAGADVHVSPVTGEGLDQLVALLIDRSRELLPQEGDVALNARQRQQVHACHSYLVAAQHAGDLLLVAEDLRLARAALDRVTGRAGVEEMLDSLFGQLCVGK